MSKSGKLWGGRFTEGPNETFSEFNNSFRFDRRLFAADVRCSIAHARGLSHAGLLTSDEAKAIIEALEEMLSDAKSDSYFEAPLEDVHSFIESKLIEMVGDAGRKLHTGRSRNDQVATALRYWLRGEIDEIEELVRSTQSALLDLAERHRKAAIPGYTHLQKAQPILFAHWCLAYFEMLKRDRDRLADARDRVNVMPLGSGALAGTGFLKGDRTAFPIGWEFCS
ncbi:lyase family protein [Leptolyngbya sp. 7M]|uniref:lyase family protein n=1 Tax=Leptolyngbya sp. 7M TaxID=2812896 RepID=UPI001B8A900C|nr:lyase family protein [Leptolyngbya sp. 7M]QYO66489.1 hypothetical protein JVX88_06725 [Leptolyngbya sp. 7M]